MNKLPKYLTGYSEYPRKNAPSGSKEEPVYGYEINKAGQKVLTQTGVKNVYDAIQESLEETKIENILNRAAAGDNSVFRPEGIYADTTEIPNNLIEARKQMMQLENLWTNLPREIKEKYNNDVETFIGASGKTEWLKDMGIIKEKTEVHAETKTESEVKKDES